MGILKNFIYLRFQGFVMGLLEWPTTDEWLISFLTLILYALIARWVGLRSGLIKRNKIAHSLWQRLFLGLRVLIHPALVEESIFRGLLVPSPTISSWSSTVLAWHLGSLLLFVLAHPANSLFFRRRARHMFTHPLFLLLATYLGVCTSALYVYSQSLWPSILFHGIVVYVWLAYYGGHSAFSAQTSPRAHQPGLD